jgi:hypothetical protein
MKVNSTFQKTGAVAIKKATSLNFSIQNNRQYQTRNGLKMQKRQPFIWTNMG